MILAGDLLGCPDGFEVVEDAQREDAKTTCRILASAACPTDYIMGNDDLVELDPDTEQIQSLHACRRHVGHWNLVGYQYSLPFMGGIFEKPEEDIRADLDELAGLVDARTVLVTHNPAYGLLDVGVLGIHAGSHAILDLVCEHRVHAHIHGHVHEQFGRAGRHFNVDSGGEHRAMMIDLDSLTCEVLSPPSTTV